MKREAAELLADRDGGSPEETIVNADRRISRRALSEEERHRLLVEWNDTATDYPRQRCVHELFAECTARTPDAVALVSGERKLTYRELDRCTNQFAHHLRTLGVGPEVVVGLCIERSPEMMIGLLGILKAGGAYLPLDQSYPRERLAYMLEDTRAPLIVTRASAAGALTGHDAQVVRIDADWAAIAEQPAASAPETGVRADNLAYVMYTSGSTGKPKGVGIVHYNISRLVLSTSYVTIGPDDAFLQLAPIAFDAATFEIWGALLNGGKLVLYPDGLLDFVKLKALIEETEITVAWLTAGLFHRAVDESLQMLAPIRQLLAGGDALSAPHVRQVLARLKGCQLINGYGPTECTTFSVCFRVPDASAVETTVPIGRPISNAQAYIVDEEFEPVPIGAAGELLIGGDGLGRGYLNRPGLTAERFIPNPFGAPGTRLYRTGDLVRYAPNGTIEFLGRIDRQLKVRGYRIEPGEIEAALLSHPGIRRAIVVASEDATGDKRLVAYLVGESGLVPEVSELRSHLRSVGLPDYMVPTAFMVLDELPLTPNGKVDRDALPGPEWRPPRNRKRGAARTPIEKAVAQIWSEILKTEDISIHDDFFDLGGTSLALITAVMRTGERFGVPLDTSVVTRGATVAALVNGVRDKLATTARLETV
jgi:amino acid adenylation domain-containing protein